MKRAIILNKTKIIFQSQKQESFLNIQVTRSKGHWIGLVDRGNGENWTWIDGLYQLKRALRQILNANIILTFNKPT